MWEALGAAQLLGFSPALPGFSADEVDFTLIGAHQQGRCGSRPSASAAVRHKPVIAGEHHLLTGQVPGRPRGGPASDHFHQSAAAQKGRFLEPVAVEVAGGQVQGLGDAQLGRVRQQKTPPGSPRRTLRMFPWGWPGSQAVWLRVTMSGQPSRSRSAVATPSAP